MFKKVTFLAAAGAGYVLGTRAGRERYEQIKTQAEKVWRSPRVQQAATDVQDYAAEQAPVVKEKAASVAKEAASGLHSASTAVADKVSRSSSGDPVPTAQDFIADTADDVEDKAADVQDLDGIDLVASASTVPEDDDDSRTGPTS